MTAFWDTIMNIQIFAFLGLLVWLYFAPSELGRKGSNREE